MNPAGFVIAAAGLFSIAGAVFDWDFFINSRKAQLVVSTLGRTGARIFYGGLGLAILVLGALIVNK